MMSGRTAKSAPELANIIHGRLDALCRAHELVQPGLDYKRAEQSHEVSLTEVFLHILAPYEIATGKPRFHLNGPEILITQDSVTSVALVFHELATNAAKYGALCSDAGTVFIQCDKLDDKVRIEWTETGGPTVEKPQKLGFGSTLSRRSVEGQLGGAIVYDWKPVGLAVTMLIPANNLCAT